MKFSWLKPFGKKAAQFGLAAGVQALHAAEAQNPVIGLVGPIVEKAIEQAQQNPGTTPEEKKTQVLDQVDINADQIRAQLQQAGLDVIDKQRFFSGADKLVDAFVDLMKSTGAMPVPSDFAPVPGATVFRNPDGTVMIRFSGTVVAASSAAPAQSPAPADSGKA